MGEIFATYIYPVIIMLGGGLLGAVGTSWYGRYRKHRAETIPEGLRELITQYECAGWIKSYENPIDKDRDKEIERARVQKKREIFQSMIAFLSNNPVNRRRLLDGGHLGSYVALAAAIRQKPSKGDIYLILGVDSTQLPKGHPQYVFIEVVEALRKERPDLTGATDRDKLYRWAMAMPDKSSDIASRIEHLR